MQQANFLTHMIFAFIEMRADGSLVVGSADPLNPEATASKSEARLQQLMAVKAKTGFRLKTLFAVGGWENSQHFSATAASAQKRSNFIRDVLFILQKYNFDGVDIDWEYPVTGGAQEGTASDKENYVIFLSEIRDRMAALQRSEGRADAYLLTIASAAGSWVLDVGYDLDKIVNIVDWINVMTYDYFGAWESKWGAYTGPPAPLYHGSPKGFSGKMNADYTLKYYACNTKRPEKIVMGVPFYGRYWYNVGGPIDASDSLWRLAEPNNQHIYTNIFVNNSGAPRCGPNAALKLDNGLLPICNPDDAAMHCCSPAGYCGNTDDYCKCDGCTDFKKMPNFAIDNWMRPLA